MSTLGWLEERIREGEVLLEDLKRLSAGPARRTEDVEKPEVVDVRDYLTRFAAWDGSNLAGLRNASPGVSWEQQYSGIEQVDRQLAITDFSTVKGRLRSTVMAKIDVLRSMTRSVQTPMAGLPNGPGRVFIGHGRSSAWRELKDHLENVLGLSHEEFEREAAAGVSITDRLEAMLHACEFAVVVMTGEDGHDDGSTHARENVIHEVGLFQGKLGMARVVVLLEEGCAEFSNIRGIVHIPFPRGRVRAAFEDVRRALEREGLLDKSARAA